MGGTEEQLQRRAQRGRRGGASQPKGEVREGGAQVGHLVRGAADQWFCKILGPGINLHLAANHMLREIFELGNPLPTMDGSCSDKPSKEERHAANQLARKIRTGIRGKNRDKRSAVVETDSFAVIIFQHYPKNEIVKLSSECQILYLVFHPRTLPPFVKKLTRNIFVLS